MGNEPERQEFDRDCYFLKPGLWVEPVFNPPRIVYIGTPHRDAAWPVPAPAPQTTIEWTTFDRILMRTLHIKAD